MHNRIIAVIAFVCLTLMSCQKDELTSIEERLSAKWYVQTEIIDKYIDDELISSDTIEHVKDILPEDRYALDEDDVPFCPPRYFAIDLLATEVYISPMHADTGMWSIDEGKFLILKPDDETLTYDKEKVYEVKNLRANNLLLQSFENSSGPDFNRFSRRLECTKEDESCILPPPEDFEFE